MSELDQTIEELEAEVLAELEEASQPNDSGIPTEKDDKKNEADDLGGADEDGNDKDREIGKKAAAAAKKAVEPKAKSSDASAKMEAAEKNEEDDDEEEEDEDMSKEDLMAAMHKEMSGMSKEDLHATYMKMGDHEKVDEEVLESHIQNIDITADVQALVDGEDLSEEFKEKAATIFEAAVKSKTREELKIITEELKIITEEQKVAMSVELGEYKDTLAEKVDQYLDYVVEEWMKENELAIERGLKGEIAEDFISGLKQLFEDHYIDVPDERYDVLEAQSDKIADLEEQLNSTMESNIQMNSTNSKLVREQVIAEVSSDLTDTQFEKFKSLTEEVDFKNQDTFREKLDTLKESYFPKTGSVETYENDDENYGSAVQDIDTTDAMKAYMSAIGRTEKRIKGAV